MPFTRTLRAAIMLLRYYCRATADYDAIDITPDITLLPYAMITLILFSLCYYAERYYAAMHCLFTLSSHIRYCSKAIFDAALLFAYAITLRRRADVFAIFAAFMLSICC